ncbi:MAG: VanZ family protein [Chloroflexota bacterium]
MTGGAGPTVGAGAGGGAGGGGRAWRLVVAWGPVVLWAALIFTLSAQPGLSISQDASVDGPLRHIAHGFVYTVLLVLIVRGMGRLGQPLTLRTAVIAAAATILYGVSDEIHQLFVPDRTGQAIDVGYDTIGAAIGLTIVWAWGRVMARRTDGGTGTTD